MEGGEEISKLNSGASVLRVLVVDDSPVGRKVVEMLLKNSESAFEVTSVDSVAKALEVLGIIEGKDEYSTSLDKKFDLVLSDYCMPEMTGFELLKAVKDNDRRKSLPVVIMSSENVPQRINSCLAAGAEDFLIKPLGIRDVQILRIYASGPPDLTPTSSDKRKLHPELIDESRSSERRLRLAGVVAA